MSEQSSKSLWAPWRIDYIRSLHKPAGDKCFLCEAAHASVADYGNHLILWQTDLSLILLNRFPYTNGHLMVVPKAHKAELADLTDAEAADLMIQTRRAVALLKLAVAAQGFNIGINLGRVAGAGVPGHLHQHVVPRWGGDVNFMSVVGEVQVVPQALTQLWREMRELVESGKA